jgi:AcrR family transcriptional regulator
VPLIDPNEVLRVGLKMLDDGGTTSLSVRALARSLGVQSSSIYHHFKDKGELEDGICRLILKSIRAIDSSEGWKEQIIAFNIYFFQALTKHPRAVPLLQVRQPLFYGIEVYEKSLETLEQAGFSTKNAIGLLRSNEALTFGFAALATRPALGSSGQFVKKHQKLVEAVGAAASTEDTLKTATIILLDGFEKRFSSATNAPMAR